MANNKQKNSNNSNNHNKSNNCERRTMNVASRRGTLGGFSEIVSPLKSLPRRLLILCPFCFCFPPPLPLLTVYPSSLFLQLSLPNPIAIYKFR